MDRTADLAAALSFVNGRVEEQAALSGELLNAEQRLLLEYIPSSSLSDICIPGPEPTPLVPRNMNLERIVALAKAAYLHDRQVNPAYLDWDFAFAVFTFNEHPMGGLLQAAGMKLRRPKWDVFRLIIIASVPTMAAVLIAWNLDDLFRSVGIASGCVALMLLMFFASRRIQKQRLGEEIERCRSASRALNAVSTVAR